MAVASNIPGTDGGLKSQSPEREAAWIGILQAHGELTRALDAALTARHGLTFGSYDALVQLARADGGHLRMTALAEGSQLSFSRVSRLVDTLQQRGLVARRSCDRDSRVVHAMITDAGRALVAEAQETFFDVVEERFLGRLPDEDVARLGALLGQLVTGPLTCPASRH
jgi:DNA-binding MarR family transcriptional regulator